MHEFKMFSVQRYKKILKPAKNVAFLRPFLAMPNFKQACLGHLA